MGEPSTKLSSEVKPAVDNSFASVNSRVIFTLKSIYFLFGDDFNRVRTEQPPPLETHLKSGPPTQDIALFFIVASKRRWHV